MVNFVETLFMFWIRLYIILGFNVVAISTLQRTFFGVMVAKFPLIAFDEQFEIIVNGGYVEN